MKNISEENYDIHQQGWNFRRYFVQIVESSSGNIVQHELAHNPIYDYDFNTKKCRFNLGAPYKILK